MLRLPGSVAPYFEQRLRDQLPTKADRILNRIREARGGKLNSSTFHDRMRGQGQYWEATAKLFKIHCERLGLVKEKDRWASPRKTFRRPSAQASFW